jgi:hypothetical protein
LIARSFMGISIRNFYYTEYTVPYQIALRLLIILAPPRPTPSPSPTPPTPPLKPPLPQAGAASAHMKQVGNSGDSKTFTNNRGRQGILSSPNG